MKYLPIIAALIIGIFIGSFDHDAEGAPPIEEIIDAAYELGREDERNTVTNLVTGEKNELILLRESDINRVINEGE